jgi:hypothetical protein
VARQGYTDREATVDEGAIVREITDHGDAAAVLAARRGTLASWPDHVASDGDGWLVVFAYRDPTQSGLGRVARVDADLHVSISQQYFVLT